MGRVLNLLAFLSFSRRHSSCARLIQLFRRSPKVSAMGFCLVVIAVRMPWAIALANFVLLGQILSAAWLRSDLCYGTDAIRARPTGVHSFLFPWPGCGAVVYGLGLDNIGATPVLSLVTAV